MPCGGRALSKSANSARLICARKHIGSAPSTNGQANLAGTSGSPPNLLFAGASWPAAFSRSRSPGRITWRRASSNRSRPASRISASSKGNAGSAGVSAAVVFGGAAAGGWSATSRPQEIESAAAATARAPVFVAAGNGNRRGRVKGWSRGYLVSLKRRRRSAFLRSPRSFQKSTKSLLSWSRSTTFATAWLAACRLPCRCIRASITAGQMAA